MIDGTRKAFTIEVWYSDVGTWHLTSPELDGILITEKTLAEVFTAAAELFPLIRETIPTMEHPEQKAKYEKAFAGTTQCT